MRETALSDFRMIFREHRLDSFVDWPFDSGPCTADKVDAVWQFAAFYFAHLSELILSVRFKCEQSDLIQMAEAGFYHCPTDQEPDLVKCFFCLKELDGWEPEDDPR